MFSAFLKIYWLICLNVSILILKFQEVHCYCSSTSTSWHQHNNSSWQPTQHLPQAVRMYRYGKSLAAAAGFKVNHKTLTVYFIKIKFWFYELHLSQKKIMILDHVSMAAIRPLKFTNKNSIFCMQTVVNSASLERNSLYNLLPSSIFILLKKRQNKRKQTVKYTKTTKWAQWAWFSRWKVLGSSYFFRSVAAWGGV